VVNMSNDAEISNVLHNGSFNKNHLRRLTWKSPIPRNCSGRAVRSTIPQAVVEIRAELLAVGFPAPDDS